MAVLDMLDAGTDTTQLTFVWCVLHMLYNKQIEKKLREEVDNEIGDRYPCHDDKYRCHYVMAFICEALRHSNVTPQSKSSYQGVPKDRDG